MYRLVEKFQCPGCVSGENTRCGSYAYSPEELRCTSHVLGTQAGVGNSIALGLPKGFNKPGFKENGRVKNTIDVRLWLAGTSPEWDHLNVAVWAMENGGFLFVRTYAPRINIAWVDVVEGGNLGMVPGAINVAEFIDSID